MTDPLRVNTDRVTHVDYGTPLSEQGTLIVVEWRNKTEWNHDTAYISVLTVDEWHIIASISKVQDAAYVNLTIGNKGRLADMEIIFEAIRVAHGIEWGSYHQALDSGFGTNLDLVTAFMCSECDETWNNWAWYTKDTQDKYMVAMYAKHPHGPTDRVLAVMQGHDKHVLQNIWEHLFATLYRLHGDLVAMPDNNTQVYWSGGSDGVAGYITLHDPETTKHFIDDVVSFRTEFNESVK